MRTNATNASDLPRIHELLDSLDHARAMRRSVEHQGSALVLQAGGSGATVSLTVDRSNALNIVNGQIVELTRQLDHFNVVDDRQEPVTEIEPGRGHCG